jgi:DNA-binding NarL/FixJ family response regulator
LEPDPLRPEKEFCIRKNQEAGMGMITEENEKSNAVHADLQSEKIRVVIADDHDVVRHGLRAILETEPRVEMSGEARTGREAVEKSLRLKPNVVVLDITMPELNGLEATRKIVKDRPETEVLILTVHESEQLIKEVLRAGAHGYMLKNDAARDLVAAIVSLSEGKPFFTSSVARMLLRGYLELIASDKRNSGPLTPREREILQLLAEGHSNKEVAAIQGVSVKTAETHRANIMRKLNFRSVCDIVHYAVRNQMIEP